MYRGSATILRMYGRTLATCAVASSGASISMHNASKIITSEVTDCNAKSASTQKNAKYEKTLTERSALEKN